LSKKLSPCLGNVTNENTNVTNESLLALKSRTLAIGMGCADSIAAAARPFCHAALLRSRPASLASFRPPVWRNPAIKGDLRGSLEVPFDHVVLKLLPSPRGGGAERGLSRTT
jgi:hypothetical protein